MTSPESPLYLDTEEQESLVESFETANAQATRTWRFCFTLLSAGLVAFYLHSASRQIFHPWDVKYHADFRQVLSSRSIQVADGVAATMLVVLIAALRGVAVRTCLLLGIFIGASLGIFWTHFIMRLPSGDRLAVIWLAVVPPVYASLMLYVERTLASTARDIAKLRGGMELLQSPQLGHSSPKLHNP